MQCYGSYMSGYEINTECGTFGVQRAKDADIESIVALLQDDPLGNKRETSDWSRYMAAFQEINEDPNQYLAVVLDAQGRVIGTMQLTLIAGLSRNAAKRLQIEAVRIASRVRGCGIGTAMFEWAHEYGREHNAELVQLTSDKSREDALKFYTSLGYVDSHEGFKLAL